MLNTDEHDSFKLENEPLFEALESLQNHSFSYMDMFPSVTEIDCNEVVRKQFQSQQENSFGFLHEPICDFSLFDQSSTGAFSQAFFDSSQEQKLEQKEKNQESKIGDSQTKTQEASILDSIFAPKNSEEDSDKIKKVDFSERTRFTKVHDRGKI